MQSRPERNCAARHSRMFVFRRKTVIKRSRHNIAYNNTSSPSFFLSARIRIWVTVVPSFVQHCYRCFVRLDGRRGFLCTLPRWSDAHTLSVGLNVTAEPCRCYKYGNVRWNRDVYISRYNTIQQILTCALKPKISLSLVCCTAQCTYGTKPNIIVSLGTS